MLYRYVLKYRLHNGKTYKLKFTTQTGCWQFIKMLFDHEQVSFIQVKEMTSYNG